MELIPHRYPFLMVDRVDAIIPDVSCIGVKNVSINEPFFMGHFPKRPVMPGVLIIESMAQTAGCLVVATLGAESEGRSEEHTSELQSLMRISYAVFCLKKKK